MTSTSVGLVLAGGAARGAWEAGVLIHMLRSVGPAIGRPFPFRFLSGTSVGAFHAALLAAAAHDPAAGAAALERAWRRLVLGRVLKVDARALGGLARALVGRSAAGGHGAFLSSLPFARLLADNVSFDHIDANLAAGRIGAVTVSATHVASGRTIVFAALAGGAPVDLGADPTMIARPVALRAPHVLASAAIPMLFPAVVVDGELYCDGGLRQLVPLRPAVRLGAHAIVVVSPRATLVPTEPANERAYSSPVYLLGKALDALLLDHVDADVERLEHLNRILAAGRRQFGPTFERELGAGLGPGVAELRTIASAVVRPSENLGCLAAEHVRSRRFARRACTPAGRLLRALADAEGGVETDLVSYLLFDGDYAGHLVDLGISDARARHDELCALLATADSARHAA